MPSSEEQKALGNLLTSTEQGGAVQAGGPLGAGADVPTVLANDPALRKLLEDSVKVSSGHNSKNPVVSSQDGQQEFDTNVADLNARTNPASLNNPTDTVDNPKGTQDNTQNQNDNTNTGDGTLADGFVFDAETGNVYDSSDPHQVAINAQAKAEIAQNKAKAAQEQQVYEDLYTTGLAAIDATVQASIDSINATFNKRIKAQERINAINIGRVTAYGLGHGGQYTPIDFSDAITNREQEAANAISDLETQRNSLIAEAKAAADSGRTDLLRQKMADLDTVENNLRSQLVDVQNESNKQYEILQSLEKQKEQEHQDKLTEARQQFALLSSSYMDRYDGKTKEEQSKLIQEIMASTGLSYADVYGQLEATLADQNIAKNKALKEAQDAANKQTELQLKIDKANQGEIRMVGGNAYQVTYDENGKAKFELVQQKPATNRGGDEDSDTSDDGEEDEDAVLSFKEFEQAAAEATDAEGNPIYTESNDDLLTQYETYLDAENQRKTLSNSDKQKMYGAGLGPENLQDVMTYIKDKASK